MNGDDFLVIISVFVISLIASALPCVFESVKRLRKFLPALLVASGGVILYSLLNDIIPHMCNKSDGEHDDGHDGCGMHVHIGCVFSGISFILLLALDVVFLEHHHCDRPDDDTGAHDELDYDATSWHYTSWQHSILFVAAISHHSLVEAINVLNMDDHTKYKVIVQLGIHKALESLSVGITVFTSGVEVIVGLITCATYSVFTPLGMVLGNVVSETNEYVRQVLNGTAVGSMLFVVFIEIIPPAFHTTKKKQGGLIALLTGYSIPVILSLLFRIKD